MKQSHKLDWPLKLFLLSALTWGLLACNGQSINIDLPATAAQPATPTPFSVNPLKVRLSQEFTLQVGQSALVENEGLTITFDSVLKDIRCPRQVECAEKGFAQILVIGQQSSQPSATYEMNTEPFFTANMGLGLNKITHSNYEIQLMALDPYPEHPDDTLDFESYKATFVISK